MKYKLKPQIFNLCVLFFFAQEANSFGQMVVQIECFVNMTTSIFIFVLAGTEYQYLHVE